MAASGRLLRSYSIFIRESTQFVKLYYDVETCVIVVLTTLRLCCYKRPYPWQRVDRSCLCSSRCLSILPICDGSLFFIQQYVIFQRASSCGVVCRICRSLGCVFHAFISSVHVQIQPVGGLGLEHSNSRFESIRFVMRIDSNRFV